MDTATVGDDTERVVDHDAVLFEQLYPSLRRFAAVTAGADGDPDDLVQEAVARTLRRHPLTALDNPGAYLRRTIVHLASNRRRSLARWRGAMSQLRPVTDEGRAAEYSSDLSDLLALHPTSRAVLYLVEVEGRSYAEAAPLVGLSEEAARARAARARAQLRRQITGELAADLPAELAADLAADLPGDLPAEALTTLEPPPADPIIEEN